MLYAVHVPAPFLCAARTGPNPACCMWYAGLVQDVQAALRAIGGGVQIVSFMPTPGRDVAKERGYLKIYRGSGQDRKTPNTH